MTTCPRCGARLIRNHNRLECFNCGEQDSGARRTKHGPGDVAGEQLPYDWGTFTTCEVCGETIATASAAPADGVEFPASEEIESA